MTCRLLRGQALDHFGDHLEMHPRRLPGRNPGRHQQICQATQFVGQVAGTHDHINSQQFPIMGHQFGRQGQFRLAMRLPMQLPRNRSWQRPRPKLFDRSPLFLQEPPGFFLFASEARLLGLVETAVLVHEVMLLHGPRNDPDQVPGGAVRDADVAIGADFVAEHGHFRLAGRAEHDDRLFRTAGTIAFDEIQCVGFTRLVATRMASKTSSRRRSMPSACPAASSKRISAALSAAKASASQAPLRLGVAIYRTFSRPGMP